MKFKYKTDFNIDKTKQKIIDKMIEKKEFYINKDGIIVSKNYSKHERNHKYYNNKYKKNRWRDKYHQSYGVIKDLCKEYYPDAKNILELGAGFGHFAEIFIDYFNPKSYTIYEFSSTVKEIESRLINKSCDISIKNEDFRNISNIEKYDCVIAMSVLEHIKWDREFLNKIKTNSWVFLSLPVTQAFEHVRGYLTPDSIVYRYRKILDVFEIRQIQRPKSSIYKSSHEYPTHWGVASIKK